MSENIAKMLMSAKQKKVRDFNVSFEDEIKRKLADQMASRKIEIQQNLFNKESE